MFAGSPGTSYASCGIASSDSPSTSNGSTVRAPDAGIRQTSVRRRRAMVTSKMKMNSSSLLRCRSVNPRQSVANRPRSAAEDAAGHEVGERGDGSAVIGSGLAVVHELVAEVLEQADHAERREARVG